MTQQSIRECHAIDEDANENAKAKLRGAKQIHVQEYAEANTFDFIQTDASITFELLTILLFHFCCSHEAVCVQETNTIQNLSFLVYFYFHSDERDVMDDIWWRLQPVTPSK